MTRLRGIQWTAIDHDHMLIWFILITHCWWQCTYSLVNVSYSTENCTIHIFFFKLLINWIIPRNYWACKHLVTRCDNSPPFSVILPWHTGQSSTARANWRINVKVWTLPDSWGKAAGDTKESESRGSYSKTDQWQRSGIGFTLWCALSRLAC